MRHYGISRRALLISIASGSFCAFAQTPSPVTQLTDAQKEEFLLNAKIVSTTAAPKGVTQTLRATLTDGTITHEASIQRIDETRYNFQVGLRSEPRFRDSWKYNLAAYKLDRLLGIDMIPPSVERRYQGGQASFTWWVEDVFMDEAQRRSKKTQPPDANYWNQQYAIVNVFDQLIYNIDRTQENLLIDKNWRLWMIDHSRAFRPSTALDDEKKLTTCDASLLEKLKQLDEPTVKKLIGPYVEDFSIKGMMARRDKIVKVFEKKGPSALFTFQRRP